MSPRTLLAWALVLAGIAIVGALDYDDAVRTASAPHGLRVQGAAR